MAHSREKKGVSITSCNPEILSTAKDTSKSSLFSLVGRALPGTVYQLLCHQISRNKLLDSHVTSKESTKRRLDLHTTWWPESSFQKLKQTSDKDHFPKITGPGSFFLSLPWTDNALTCISQLLQKGGTSLIVGFVTRNLNLSRATVIPQTTLQVILLEVNCHCMPKLLPRSVLRS